MDSQDSFSIKSIIQNSELHDKIFSTNLNEAGPKLNLVQFTDMTKDVMNQTLTQEMTFLTMMNATVSHDMRGPLGSIMSEIKKIQSEQRNFKKILEHMRQ